ncbi:MIP/aquaporin family protein [Nocardioides cynanchi]|uniref:MIP/aquaporin family protein n=1 Tax=Nocardioides cynanchi TaxID=2558918 RepID=UPI001EE385C0|nr:MIP family channel protein [Nocardioides cynanchi]
MSDMTVTAAPELGQKLVAEFLGTFVLVFFGVGSVVILGAAGGNLPDYTGVALTFGIAVAVMIYAVGRISGGHFNPAVSIGAAIGGRVPWSEALAYMVTQVVGATVGALALFVVAHGYDGFSSDGRMGTNSFGHGLGASGISWWAAFVLELILTAVFVFVILAVTDSRNEHPALAPLAIGLTLFAVHMVAIPATGTSVNPARSIGPALFGGSEALKHLWLFILAPLVGGAVSGLVYPALFGRGVEPVAGSGLRFGTGATGAVPGYGAPDAFQQQWQEGNGAAGDVPPPAAPTATPPDDDGRTQIRPQQ